MKRNTAFILERHWSGKVRGWCDRYQSSLASIASRLNHGAKCDLFQKKRQAMRNFQRHQNPAVLSHLAPTENWSKEIKYALFSLFDSCIFFFHTERHFPCPCFASLFPLNFSPFPKHASPLHFVSRHLFPFTTFDIHHVHTCLQEYCNGYTFTFIFPLTLASIAYFQFHFQTQN